MNKIIRIRACLLAIYQDQIILVPHYDTNEGPLVWYIPGGKVEFGESFKEAAVREFKEETGLDARIDEVLDIYEMIRPEKPSHSITITFLGTVKSGLLKAETNHPYGEKKPQWFTASEMENVKYYPPKPVEKALKIIKKNM